MIERQLTYYLILQLCLLLAAGAMAQTGFYVPKRAKIFFAGDTATVFSDVTNEGKLGIGKKAVVNMAAKTWRNDQEAEIATDDNGEGGEVRFIGSQRQQLDAGYNAAVKTGAVFQQLQLDNAAGLELINSAAKVHRRINFRRGLIYLNQQSFSIGNGRSDGIIGYDSSRYFVTGAGIGLLIREAVTLDNDWVVFPVGSEAHRYTPGAVRSLSGSDDYFFTVMDSVRSLVNGGRSLINEGVGTTWQVGKRFSPGVGGVEVALQHLNEQEGSLFTAKSNNAYISQFDGGRWDVGYPQVHPGIGHLTSGAALTNSGTNSRQLVSIPQAIYLTKFTGAGSNVRVGLRFNAYRLDASNVKAYWNTYPELNIHHFVVQRRLANETVFKSVDSLNSKAMNGYSDKTLDYTINDPNAYLGISYYRLLSIDFNGDTTYSQIVAVGFKAGETQSELWPYVSRGHFTVAINATQPVKKLIVWDVLGQKVMELSTNGQRVVQVDADQLAAANYYISLIGMFDTIIETKKFVIAR